MDDSVNFTFVLFTAVISAVVAGLVAFIVCYNTNQATAKKYKELIAAERIKRLNAIRQCMADYLVKSYYILNLKYDTEHEELLGNEQNSAEIAQLSFLLQLALNPQQENHRNLLDKLSDLDELAQNLLSRTEDMESMFVLYGFKLTEFSKACKELLKDEWDIMKSDTAIYEAAREV